MNGFSIGITIFGGLGLFLFGMKIMSESLQQAAGERLKGILWRVSSNRFKGVFTGLFITSIIQSSSATTVMLVSFVSAGLLTLQQSIGIIYGANIGTTVTGWLVALIGFKVKITAVALPCIGIGFFIRFISNEKVRYYGEVLLGFGVLFFGLDIMSNAVKDLRNSEAILSLMSRYSAVDIPSTLIVVVIGTIITMIVQSSSATVAMTMTLAVNGLIDFPTACAFILGENIGTTITANIAAIGASTEAKQAARAHFLFNLIGVIWIMFIFHKLFVPFVDWLVPGNPYSDILAVRSKVIADHMAAFHTAFNVINTIVFLPFVDVLAKLATKLAPKPEGEKDEFHLKYITTALVATPTININQARLEIKRMCGIVLEMFDMVMEVFHHPKEKLGTQVEQIIKLENLTDHLEKEISNFLVNILQNNISYEQSEEVSSLLHTVNELERIGDNCESLLKLIRRKYEQGIEFSDEAVKGIDEIAVKVREFLVLINDNITIRNKDIMSDSKFLEDRIDELRNELRKGHVNRLNEGICDVNAGLIFIDMLSKFEKIGDHAFNVAESISGVRVF
ncbi:MAG: Na/Pi cotransporter family protein [Spirochaetes bacterium]|nr:Na/Pi cotransporter family protein [Spirochaetota bacterium]